MTDITPPPSPPPGAADRGATDKTDRGASSANEYTGSSRVLHEYTDIPPFGLPDVIRDDVMSKWGFLNTEQREAFLAILQNNNVFISGSGGTGKSAFVRLIYPFLVKLHRHARTVAVTAMTGSAAVNLATPEMEARYPFYESAVYSCVLYDWGSPQIPIGLVHDASCSAI